MKKKVISTYAAYSKEEDIRLKSSSGAIFSLLAKYVLEQQGVIYGVAMTSDCKAAEIIRIDSEEELYRLRGSKYMQAKVGHTYIQVRKDLNDGKKVLFSGTGCQVNGLKCYLNMEYENLFCVDVVCHGVPTPLLWKKYVENIEYKNDARLMSVDFRCKEVRIKEFSIEKINSQFKEVYISSNINPYMRMFLKDYCLRPSCYACIIKDKKMSDMTIADFWGIESIAPEMNDGKGISLVMVRTSKGKDMFENIKEGLHAKSVEYDEGVRANPAEYCSVKRPEEREKFFFDMHTMTFDQLAQKYVVIKKPIKIVIKKRIKDMIMKTPIKKLIFRSKKNYNYANYGMKLILQNK